MSTNPEGNVFNLELYTFHFCFSSCYHRCRVFWFSHVLPFCTCNCCGFASETVTSSELQVGSQSWKHSTIVSFNYNQKSTKLYVWSMIPLKPLVSTIVGLPVYSMWCWTDGHIMPNITRNKCFNYIVYLSQSLCYINRWTCL